MDTKTLAAELGVTPKQLHSWVVAGYGNPKYRSRNGTFSAKHGQGTRQWWAWKARQEARLAVWLINSGYRVDAAWLIADLVYAGFYHRYFVVPLNHQLSRGFFTDSKEEAIDSVRVEGGLLLDLQQFKES